MIVAARKIGRCANGAERGKGFVYHALNGGWAALCGTEPGRQSAGWQSEPEPAERVNCPRCLKRMAASDGCVSNADAAVDRKMNDG